MKAIIQYKGSGYSIDLMQPLDISLPVGGGDANVTAWHQGPPEIFPHDIGGKPGRVSEGASVNFNDISFNPHSHGTHTECVGHIHPESYPVNRYIKRHFYKAIVLTVNPEKHADDRVISAAQLEKALETAECEAVIIRTLPNTPDKRSRSYSGTNPPYLSEGAARYLAGKGITQLLVDLPSVDREDDGGALLAHRAFWNFSGPLRMEAMITELVYVPEEIMDGAYFLDLQVAPFINDASPSRPILYKAHPQ